MNSKDVKPGYNVVLVLCGSSLLVETILGEAACGIT